MDYEISNSGNSENETLINKEYDFSTVIPTADGIGYLVKYMDDLYKKLLQLIHEDDERNSKFKYDFQNYEYKKAYSLNFEIYISFNGSNYITCKDYNSYMDLVKSDGVKNVSHLDISLNLDYQRGPVSSLVNHNNSFKIRFAPYNIKFTRKSNHNEEAMNEVEKNIVEMLNKFPSSKCIFSN